MTNVTKALITNLMDGCSIYTHPLGLYLRGTENNFIRKINPRTYRQVKRYLRKRQDGLFAIDKRRVRSEHGNTWIKQQYKKQLKTIA